MSQAGRAHPRQGAWLALALVLALLGAGQFIWARQQTQPPVPRIEPGQTTSGELGLGAHGMDASAIHYSPGWRVALDGADPPEPADAVVMPSGTLTFTWSGRDLALLLAPGDYRGHVYVAVDGEPANRLPQAAGHAPSPARPYGYKPLYAPERAVGSGPGEQWLLVHRADASGPHEAHVEVWRSWGQTPLRAIAVDTPLPQQSTTWPGVALFVTALWCAAPLWMRLARWLRAFLKRSPPALVRTCQRALGARAQEGAGWAALAASATIVVATWLDIWWLCAAALILLALAGLLRPALWFAALLFALPFYFRFALPLLPGRAVNLIDTGVVLGLGIALLHAAVVTISGREARTRFGRWPLILLALLASWALVATDASEYRALALREWRTVFLMAAVLAAGLTLSLHVADHPRREIVLLFGGWLAGASVLASAALMLYPSTSVTIPAEGVARLRAFYGSPNNLALYLERTLAVSLALALVAASTRIRVAAALLALPQAIALLFTFSRGALFVALPATIISIWVLGMLLLRRQQRSTRILWALAAVLGLAALAVVPFLGAERFREVASLAQGTGFLRLNLWRSAWQMGWEHPLFGVGPDNFLYAYRSDYILPQAWMEPNLNHPHNWLLDWWTRLGLPGLALGIVFWFSVAKGLLRKVLSAGALAGLATGALAATITALAHGLLDASYALPDLMAVWALFAVLSSIDTTSVQFSVGERRWPTEH